MRATLMLETGVDWRLGRAGRGRRWVLPAQKTRAVAQPRLAHAPHHEA